MDALSQDVIERGNITFFSNMKQYPYIIRVLNQSDLKQVIALQSKLSDAMEQKELYVPIPEEELRYMLYGHGESLGLFIEDHLFAACSLLFDVNFEINMAREIDFSDEDLSKVAQLELSLVDMELRGHKLQYKLADILIRRAEASKKCRYIFTTVSPYNYPSIQTVTGLGLQIVRLCKMYYDWDRYVVYKDLINPANLDTSNPTSIVNTNFAMQQQLLRAGYRGYSQFKDQNGIKIMYAKLL